MSSDGSGGVGGVYVDSLPQTEASSEIEERGKGCGGGEEEGSKGQAVEGAEGGVAVCAFEV